MKKFLLFFSIIFLLKFYSSEAKEVNILALSDIHYDPLLDCPKTGRCEIFEMLKNQDEDNWKNIFENYSSHVNSKYKQDTNYNLLNNMLFENRNSINHIVQNTKISFVIVNGDFIGHGLKRHYYNLNNNSYDGYSDFIKKIIKFLSKQIRLSLSSPIKSSIIIFPALGNNDSYVDNYFVDDSDSDFYKDTAETWKELLPKITKTKFIHNGFYSYQLDGLNSKLIVLNSNLFSIYAKSNDENKLDIAANEQLNWLNNELNIAKTKNQKIILAFHIPATMNPYFSSIVQTAIMFWKTEYQKNFLQIIKDHKNEVIAIFNSHIHSDAAFVYLSNDNQGIQLFSTLIPSISPIHSNNPGFKIFHFSSNHLKQPELKNIDTYFYDLSAKNSDIKIEYNFDQTYRSENVRDGIANLLNSDLTQDYFRYYNLNTKFISPDQQKYYVCSIKFVTKERYNSCIK